MKKKGNPAAHCKWVMNHHIFYNYTCFSMLIQHNIMKWKIEAKEPKGRCKEDNWWRRRWRGWGLNNWLVPILDQFQSRFLHCHHLSIAILSFFFKHVKTFINFFNYKSSSEWVKRKKYYHYWKRDNRCHI